jgi:GNAT superfamily N-acetyltransferase
MILAMEELSMNAWPSLQTMFFDGWVMRFAEGYTKRANSVHPLYHSTIDLDEKIGVCKRAYCRKKLPLVFKMTPATHPNGLDERLASMGYRKASPTSVQVVDLGAMRPRAALEASAQESISSEWMESYCRLSAIGLNQQPVLQRILQNIVPRHSFFSLKLEGRIIACGLGVLQAGHLGLFDIVTASAFRGRGHGRQIVESLLAWGQRHGAWRAYLQVMLDNAPALDLYANVGILEQYQYWYRIQP